MFKGKAELVDPEKNTPVATFTETCQSDGTAKMKVVLKASITISGRVVWPERCPGGACGCRPGQGGEDRVTLLAFRSRPREAGHISDRARCCCRLARGEPACASD